MLLIFIACNSGHTDNFSIQDIETPCIHGGEPNLFYSTTSELYLSWIEYADETIDVLKFSKWHNNQWSKPENISSGTDWFVNWADYPSIVSYNSGYKTLAAHWLQKSAEGTYDYDIHVSQSIDGGTNWMPSFILHNDGIAAEHGFVSMIPEGKDRIFACWLDGRNTKLDTKGNHNHMHSGSMTLRSASFDIEGNMYDEIELDSRVCDCCQTSAAMTDKGIIVAYRDRSDGEIRDISVVRQIEKSKWSNPIKVYNDEWEIAGCPVNGPVVRAQENRVAVAWYTNANSKAKVQVSLSDNSGKNFGPAIRLDGDDPIGRVDLMWLEDELLVSWIEEDEVNLKTAILNSKGEMIKKFDVTDIEASRSSGFPKMGQTEENIIFVWTDNDSIKTIRSAIIEKTALFNY